jgi:outer membrane protein insertion porin family
MRYLCCALLVCMVLFACLGRSWSQVGTQPIALYQGQKVSAVEIAGRPGYDHSWDRLIVQRAGQPFSQQVVQASAEALKKIQGVTDVRLQVLPEAEGLRVMFVLDPALYVGLLEFPGAGRFQYSTLLQTANYPNEAPYADSYVKQSQAALVKFFRLRGFFLPQVTPEVKPDPAHGLANIDFHVTTGPRAKYGTVNIIGTTPEESAKLQSSMHSIRARFRGARLKQGKTYTLKHVRLARTWLQGQLAKQNYLAGTVHMKPPEYDPQTNRADLIFEVNPGPVVLVKTEGAKISGRQKHKLIPIFTENTVDEGLIQEGRRNVLSYFQKKGFFDAKVEARSTQKPGLTEIVYHITEGPRHKVVDIDVHGNEYFSDRKIPEQVKVQRARRYNPFSHGSYSDNLVRASVNNIENLYKNAGFSQVVVTPVVKRKPDVDITFQIAEGSQDMVETMRLEGNNSKPESALAPKGLNLGPGKPYSQRLLQQDRNTILASYLNDGYLNANVTFKVTPAGSNPHRVNVVFDVSEGPQVRANSVVVVGANHTRWALLKHVVTVHEDKPVSEKDMLQSESGLYELTTFDSASVGPRRPITDQPETEIVIKVHESKRNSITYGFGFESLNRGGNVPGGTVALPGLPPIGLPAKFQTTEKRFWGPRGSLQYTRSNIRGMGEQFNIAVLGARLDQRAAMSYSQPSFWGSTWSSSSSVSTERTSENPIFTARLGDAGFQLYKFLDRKKTMRFFARYDFKKTVLTNLLIPELVSPQDRNIRLSSLTGSFIRDTRDNPLDAHHGLYQSLDLGVNPSFLGSSTSFARVLAQSAVYLPVKNMVWANDIRLGMENPFLNGFIPLSERFYSGGGSTLRGFPLNGAGPQRSVPVCSNPADPSTCATIQVPVGGPQLFIFNSELRFPIPIKKGLGGAAFYDGGNVFDKIGLSHFIRDYSNTVGFGLRYQTPVGPVRIDIGHNLNPVPGLKSTQIFITLGQAF